MATKKKTTSASRPAAKPAAKQLNGHAPDGRSTGTAEARDTARLLLEIEAIHCRPDNPYIRTSWPASPVDIDCPNIINSPEPPVPSIKHACKSIERDIGWNK